MREFQVARVVGVEEEVVRRLIRGAKESEAAAVDECLSGRRTPRLSQHTMTRRHFLKTTGAGIAAVSFLPITTTSCDPATIMMAIALIKLAKEFFPIIEDVQGYVQLINNGESPFRGEMLMELIQEQFGYTVQEGLAVVDVPANSDPIFNFAGLYGDDYGEHSVQGTVSAHTKKSGTFQIVEA